MYRGSEDLGLPILDRVILGRKGIACLRIQFSDSSDIACMKLRNLNGAASFKHIQFAEFFLCLFGHIVKGIIVLDNTGADLDERIFTDEGIHNGLEDLSRLRFCEIIICLKDFVALGQDTCFAFCRWVSGGTEPYHPGGSRYL